MKKLLYFISFLCIVVVGCNSESDTKPIPESTKPEPLKKKEDTSVDKSNITLSEDTLTIILTYLPTTGPSWLTEENLMEFEYRAENGMSIGDSIMYFIEPEDSSITTPFQLVEICSGKWFKLEGRFYKKMQTRYFESHPESGITFQYFKAELIE